MKIKIPIPGIILITEYSQFEIAMAFMRLQEFYECSDIKRQGKFFTLEEVVENYAQNGPTGKFSYLDDWMAFNVPGSVVDEFRKMYKHDLSARETALMLAIDRTLAQEENATCEGKYYVIGSCSEIYEDHEICHGMWGLYPEYRADAVRIIKKFTKTQKSAVIKMLKDMGYADNVLEDEFNAYVSTSDMYYIRESVFEHFEEKGNSKWNWDKVYLLVKNYWEWKNELAIDEDNQEIKLK